MDYLPITNEELKERHTSTQHLMRQFRYEHLPIRLQQISMKCYNLALEMISILPDSPELSAALRKLLEAKDCLVRSAVDDGIL